jgi:hypothetical protein
MEQKKPIASLSLDLDNQWSYMKTHGDRGWETYPSYLDLVVPRILDFLKQRDLKITFFIVGQDAALDKNREAIKSIADAGHEIGNHSFHHNPWLHLYSEGQLETEIILAEQQIEWVTGQRTVGFRGPGYSLSEPLLRVLVKRGYLYDASTLPTFLGPLARTYYFMTTKLSAEQKRQRAKLFGSFKHGLLPLKPYRWNLNIEGATSELMEIPVSTMPIFKVPFHFSYVLYLSTFSPNLGALYFKTAMFLCRLTRTQPSLLLHPLDFLGSDDLDELDFFPAMKHHSERKMKQVSKALALFANEYSILSIHQYTTEVLKTSSFSKMEPSFETGQIR